MLVRCYRLIINHKIYKTVKRFFVHITITFYFLHFHEIVTRNRGGVQFSLQFVCVSVCVCMCVCFQLFLWTKFQLNGCTDLDAVFAKCLLSTLARTLLKLVIWVKGQGHSASISIFFSSQFFVNFPTVYISSCMFNKSEI